MSVIANDHSLWLGTMVQNIVRTFAWSLLLFLPLVFVWHESSLQYDIYIDPDFGLTVHRLSIFSVVLLALGAARGCFPKPLLQIVIGYALVCSLYAVLDRLTIAEIPPLYFVKGIAIAFLMLPIISDRRLLHVFVRLNFLVGFIMIALTTVPVLHWLELASLSYEQVPRVPAPPPSPYDFDPYHFGVFGLTENFPYPGHPLEVARLQGFSFEPIHWAYFVLLTVSSGLFSRALTGSRLRLADCLVGCLFAVHLFFVYSTTAFIATLGWLGAVGFVHWRRIRSGCNPRREVAIGFILLILIPGLLIPFVLAQLPGIGFLLVAEDILNKGANWEGKIGFLSLGWSLYTRFLPSFTPMPGASHNLVLSTYIQFGYLLLLPLIAFCWLLLKRAFSGQALTVVAGTALAILAHILVVPPQFFYPSGAMWLLMAAGVAFHSRGGKPRVSTHQAVL